MWPQKNEQMICKEKVDEACQVVCKVIAPNASEQLLHAYKQSARPDCESDALTTAYKNAPTKTLKIQILSIYALKYSCDELKRIHAPFENLSDRQIKKAKKTCEDCRCWHGNRENSLLQGAN